MHLKLFTASRIIFTQSITRGLDAFGDFHKSSLLTPLPTYPARLIDTKCLVNPDAPALSHLRPLKDNRNKHTNIVNGNFTSAIKATMIWIGVNV